MTVNAVPMADRPFPTEYCAYDQNNDMDVFAFVFFACCVELFLFKFFDYESRRKNLQHLRHRDILNAKLKVKVASKAEDDHQEKFFEVRDYLERLVEGLVDGGLDDVCLTPLSTHPQYMSICWKYHEQLATTLTAAIQSIINDSRECDDIPGKLNKILEEVSNDVKHLPELQVVQKKCAVPLADDLHEKNYEDLLATAILNKLVSNSQTKKKIPNGRTRTSKYSQKQFGVNDSSSSSHKTDEPWRTPRLSLTVEEFTEEVTTTRSYSNTYSDIEGDYDDGYNEGDDEDDERSQSAIGMFMSNAKLLRGHKAPLPEFGSDVIDGTDGSTVDPDDHVLSATVDSWEDNWLFQKKKITRQSNNYHHHPVPVPMLVPNPCEVTRPLIGDRDADETSELSDYSNSALDELLELSDFESEHLLPTKRSDDVDTNSFCTDRMTFDGPSSDEDNPLHWNPVVEACNKHVALSQVDSGQGSMDHQRDFDHSPEVNEKPVPTPRFSVLSNTTDSEVNSISSEEIQTIQEDQSLPPRPGTIAEREHSKWENAVPMMNNPYSAENIEKRKYKSLFGSRSNSEASLSNLNNVNDTPGPTKIICSPSLPDTQKYGRDYYINQSGELKTRQKQTKVSKLVVQLDDEDETGSGDSARDRRHQLVRVCSWTDRRNGGSKPQNLAEQPFDDVQVTPSVRELAKHFSSNSMSNVTNKSNRQMHSLTARNICREFRVGLGLNSEKSGHRAVHESDDSGNGSAEVGRPPEKLVQ